MSEDQGGSQQGVDPVSPLFLPRVSCPKPLSSGCAAAPATTFTIQPWGHKQDSDTALLSPAVEADRNMRASENKGQLRA